MSPEKPEIERSRVRQVFRYLEALNQLRNSPKRQIQEQPWVLWFRDIPQHDSIKKGVVGDVQPAESKEGGELPAAAEDIVLKVSRPRLTPAPTPPDAIKLWLRDGWEHLDGYVETLASKNEISEKGETVIVRFEDDADRPRVLEQWRGVRDEWVQNERPAREALKLFEKLYELHGQIEREAERVELVLGDGLLNWRRPEGGVNHPVLLKRLQLEFNPEGPEFTLAETGHPTELYSALFRTMAEVDGRILGRCREELEKGNYHPLGGEDTSGFLRRLVAQLHANGQFIGFDPVQGEQDVPRMGRSPVIFMRNRTLGFANSLDAILEDIQKRTEFPFSLVNIVGIETAPPESTPDPDAQWVGSGNENAEILLSKPANVEQLHIAERLNQYGCVVVQGPPGTGKTHTIGNLLGHLLAEGKSVLVTSHTTKALRVLRDKVAEPLQPLCVSVLESDLDSRKQLESSVSKIVERLGSASVERLASDANSLRSQREKILEQLAKARKELLAARSSEYDDIVLAGKPYPPSTAARLVAKETRDNWIPSPVVLGQPLPLSFDELAELYRSNIAVPSTDQAELEGELPELELLLRPEEFRALVDDQAKLERLDRKLFERFWSSVPTAHLLVCPHCNTKNRVSKESAKKKVSCGQCKKVLPELPQEGGSVSETNRLEELSEALSRALETFSQDEPWRLAAIWAGQAGGKHRAPWDGFLAEIAHVCQKVVDAQEILLKLGPEVPHDLDSEEGLALVDEIINHLALGGSLSWWTNLTKPKWKAAIPRLIVSGRPPRTSEHFQAIKVCIEISLLRRALKTRWHRQMVPLGAPSADELGAQPESSCKIYAELLLTCLEWHSKTHRHQVKPQ